MKRTLTLMLCMLLLVSMLFTSCNNDTANDDGKGNAESTAGQTTKAPSSGDGGGVVEDEKEAVIEDWLPVESYGVDGGNREIKMLTCNTYNKKYYFFREDDGNGDPLATASMSRYFKISETYDVVMSTVEPTSGGLFGHLQSSLYGQGGDYDLVYPHPTSEILAILESGFFENLWNFEHLHLDQPWWSQNQVDTYTIDDKLYIAVSDFSLSGQGFVSLIFNRAIYNDLQIGEDLYDVVDDGEWTLAKMREVTMKFGQDVDSNDIYDANDQYGFIYQPQHTKNFYWALGGKIIDRDANDQHYLAIDSDRTSRMATELFNLAYGSEDKVWLSEPCVYDTFAKSNGWGAFKGQQGLFMTYDLGGLYSHLNELTFKVGYLPYPKLDTEQTNYPVVCAAGFFAIPKKAPDAQMSSVLLEALSIYSYANYRPTFFNTILLGRMSEQEEDYEMLEFLHESKMFDLGFTFEMGGSASILYDVVIADHSNEVASLIRGRWNDMEKTLDCIESIRTGAFEGMTS